MLLIPLTFRFCARNLQQYVPIDRYLCSIFDIATRISPAPLLSQTESEIRTPVTPAARGRCLIDVNFPLGSMRVHTLPVHHPYVTASDAHIAECTPLVQLPCKHFFLVCCQTAVWEAR